jgi:polyhydroxyalkanoate synthesis regulator phasin
MSISARRKLAVGATGLVVLAGSGGAYAAAAGNTATPTPTSAAKPADHAAEQKAFLDDVAKRLNVTSDQLTTAIKGAAAARIDAAVAAGKLTKEQGDEAKKRLASGAPLLGPGLLGGRPGDHRGPGGPGPVGRGFGGFGLDDAAKYLGLTDAKLREQLEAGKSLADVAKAQNKDLAGLKAALKTAVTTKLDQAVKDGHITEAQKTKMLADIDKRIDEIVNNTPPAGGRIERHP